MMLLVSLLSTILLVTAKESHSHVDDGEYGRYSTWRQAVCEKNDQDMLKELEVCFKKEDPVVVDAVVECIKKADPASGDTIDFTNAACQDVSIFAKFDECFDEYEHDEEFSTHLEVKPTTVECYDSILEKHAMDKLREYLKAQVEEN